MDPTECMLSPGSKRACFGKVCDECGWNPCVARARAEQIYKEFRGADIKHPYHLKVRRNDDQ